MKCNFFLFCDAANATRENKQNLLGVFSNIFAKAAPMIHPTMAIAYEISEVPMVVQSTLQLTITSENGSEVFRTQQVIPSQQVAQPQSIGGVFGINGLQLPTFGRYTAMLHLNGDEVARNEFTVTQIQ